MAKDSPFTGQTIFVALRDALAELYIVDQDARRVVDDAGLIAIQITFCSRPQTNWHNILAEAIRQGHLDVLLKIALSDYAANPALLAVYGQYRLFVDEGGYLEAPAQLAGDGVMITGDVKLDQGDFVGRDKNVRSIITGRDIIGSLLITGDHNQVFVGDYEQLQDAYINPGSIFDRVRLEFFTGREWLLAEVDNFLQTHDRGYFILEADAGLGKTTFMAWLTKQRHYIHHFSELAPGQEGMGIALRNLAAQLAMAYKLLPEGVLPNAVTRPDYLYTVLKQAATQRQQGEKIVLLVDALDEAGTPINQNVLGLPSVLPEGVYVIVSQRPVVVALHVDTASTPRYRLPLASADTKNQTDMRRFLEQTTTWPEVTYAIQETGYTSKQFTETLLDKCRGVWIYLHYVVHEIVRGERSPLALAALPNGMTQYYAQYWRRWRTADETQWDECYLPLLTTLAAAREAISCQQLIAWSRVKQTERSLRRLLEEHWRPVLAVDQHGQERRYRFYHATLQEFFDGRLTQGTLSSAEIALVTELTEETSACHSRLAERYLQVWGGLAAGLPGLQEETKRDLDEQYGIRHLVAHLAAASRIGDIHHLLKIEWVRTETMIQPAKEQMGINQSQEIGQVDYIQGYQNVWYSVREALGQTDGYLMDVTHAWRLAEKYFYSKTAPNVLALNGRTGKAFQHQLIGLQCRYALIITSLNSLAQNILPGLLVELVKKRVLSSHQGLTYARQMPVATQRAEALINLVSYLPNEEQERVIQESLRTAQSIDSNHKRVKALVNLVPYFASEKREKILKEVLNIAKNLKYDFSNQFELINLVPYLSPIQVQEILDLVQNIKDDYCQRRALIDLAPYLSIVQLQEAVNIAQRIENDSGEWVLANIALQLAKHGQLQEALNLAQSMKVSHNRSYALAHFVPRLAEQGKLMEALRLAHGIADDHYRATALIHLAPWLTESQQILEALYIAQNIWDDYSRARTLIAFIPYTASVEKDKIIEKVLLYTTEEIGHRNLQAEALASLIPYLPEAEQEKAFQKVSHIIYDIEDKLNRGSAFSHLALQFAQQGQTLEALRLVRHIDQDITDASRQSETLVKLTSFLTTAEQGQLPEEILRLAQDIENNDDRAEVLANLAAYLSTEQLQEALRSVRRIGDRYRQVQALVSLVPQLAKLGRIQETLYIVQNIFDSSSQADVLVELAPYLVTAEQIHLPKETLHIARSICNRSNQVAVLASMASHLPVGEQEKVLQEALHIAHSIEDSYERAKVLVNLAAHLATSESEKVLQEVMLDVSRLLQRIPDGYSHLVVGLTTLLPYLVIGREKVLEEMLHTARRVKDSYDRAKILTALARYLTLDQLQEALRAARSIRNSYNRAKTLASLAPYFTAGECEKVLQEALSAGRRVKNSLNRAEILTNLAIHFSVGQREKILQEALHTAQGIKYRYEQATALANLVTYLPVEEQENVLQEVIKEVLRLQQYVPDPYNRAIFLDGLLSPLSKLSLDNLFAIWCKILPGLSSYSRNGLLAAFEPLAPLIASLGGADAIVEVVQAIQDVDRWWP